MNARGEIENICERGAFLREVPPSRSASGNKLVRSFGGSRLLFRRNQLRRNVLTRTPAVLRERARGREGYQRSRLPRRILTPSRSRRLCMAKSTEQYGKSAANTGWNVGPYCNADTSTQWRGRMLHTLCLVIAQITVTNSTASNGGCSTFTRRRLKTSRRSLTCNSILDGSQRISGSIPCYIPVPVRG